MGKGKVGDSKILVPVGKEIFKNIKLIILVVCLKLSTILHTTYMSLNNLNN